MSTAFFILPVLKQVAALGKALKLSAKNVCFQASAQKYTLVSAGTQTAVRGKLVTFALLRSSTNLNSARLIVYSTAYIRGLSLGQLSDYLLVVYFLL